jgi:hypothetical protein
VRATGTAAAKPARNTKEMRIQASTPRRSATQVRAGTNR